MYFIEPLDFFFLGLQENESFIFICLQKKKLVKTSTPFPNFAFESSSTARLLPEVVTVDSYRHSPTGLRVVFAPLHGPLCALSIMFHVGMRILLGNEFRWHTSSVGTRIPLGCKLCWDANSVGMQAPFRCKIRWDASSVGMQAPLGHELCWETNFATRTRSSVETQALLGHEFRWDA
jgi:hypothetical protein